MASAIAAGDFDSAVAEGAQRVRAGEVDKVVLAREVRVSGGRPFNPGAVFGAPAFISHWDRRPLQGARLRWQVMAVDRFGVVATARANQIPVQQAAFQNYGSDGAQLMRRGAAADALAKVLPSRLWRRH